MHPHQFKLHSLILSRVLQSRLTRCQRDPIHFLPLGILEEIFPILIIRFESSLDNPEQEWILTFFCHSPRWVCSNNLPSKVLLRNPNPNRDMEFQNHSSPTSSYLFLTKQHHNSVCWVGDSQYPVLKLETLFVKIEKITVVLYKLPKHTSS